MRRSATQLAVAVAVALHIFVGTFSKNLLERTFFCFYMFLRTNKNVEKKQLEPETFSMSCHAGPGGVHAFLRGLPSSLGKKNRNEGCFDLRIVLGRC